MYTIVKSKLVTLELITTIAASLVYTYSAHAVQQSYSPQPGLALHRPGTILLFGHTLDLQTLKGYQNSRYPRDWMNTCCTHHWL